MLFQQKTQKNSSVVAPKTIKKLLTVNSMRRDA
jgi:hypothetical protein